MPDQKTRKLTFRLSEEEWGELQEKIQVSGVKTSSDYVRAAVLNHTINTQVISDARLSKELGKQRHDFARLGNYLKSVVRNSNQPGYKSTAQELIKKLDELRVDLHLSFRFLGDPSLRKLMDEATNPHPSGKSK